MYTGLLPWQQSSQNMKLTTHLHLTQVMQMCAATSFYFPPYAFMVSQGAPLPSYATFISIVFTSSLMSQSTFQHLTYLKTYICACHLAVMNQESCCGYELCYVEAVLAFLSVMPYLCQQNQQPVNDTQQMFMIDFYQLQSINTVPTWSK